MSSWTSSRMLHGFSCSGCNPMGTASCNRYDQTCICRNNRYTGQYCNHCARSFDYMDDKGECHGCPCNLQWSNGSCFYIASMGQPGCDLCLPGMTGRLCDECDQDKNYVFDIPTGKCVLLSEEEQKYGRIQDQLAPINLPINEPIDTYDAPHIHALNHLPVSDGYSNQTYFNQSSGESLQSVGESSATAIGLPSILLVAGGSLATVILMVLVIAVILRRFESIEIMMNISQKQKDEKASSDVMTVKNITEINVVPNRLFDIVDLDGGPDSSQGSSIDEHQIFGPEILRRHKKSYSTNKGRKLITSMQQALSGNNTQYYFLADQGDDDKEETSSV